MIETLTFSIGGKPIAATFEYDAVKQAEQEIESTNTREGMARPKGE